MNIAMCRIQDCPLKVKCYRANATADPSQVFFKEDPRKDAWHRPSDCELYIPMIIEIPTEVIVGLNPLLQFGSSGVGSASGEMGVLWNAIGAQEDRESLNTLQEYTTTFGDIGNDRVIRYRIPFLFNLKKRWLKFIGVYPVNIPRFSIACGCLFIFLILVIFGFAFSLKGY
jgi:hypothetical protein